MGQLRTIVSPELGSASFLTLLRLDLHPGECQTLETGGREYVVDVLAGRCATAIVPEGGAAVRYDSIGGRSDIFGGAPEFVYVPRKSTCEIECLEGALELVIYTAPTEEDAAPSYLAADQVKVVESGASDWMRRVFIGLDEAGPSTRIMVGETESPPGNWSGFPPHRHAQDSPPGELAMEEVYYFQLDPRNGFVIGCTYEDPADKGPTSDLAIYRHGEAFAVPRGFHFIAPCPGYRVRYTWALGGRHRGFGAWTPDPELSWLSEVKD